MRITTPLGWAADRWSLSSRALRWSTTAALAASILIIVTGGLVRITGSGLGCSEWPLCTGDSLVATPEMGIHGAIEFSNRMLTTVIVLAVGWVIITARLQRPRDRVMTRLAWSQFWIVVANAVIGGVSVWVKLNPYVVAFHFLAAMALLTTTTLTWHRVHAVPSAYAPSPGTKTLSGWLAGVTTVLVIAGTVVTGSGPHSGDSSDVPRMGFDWDSVTWVHGVLGVATLVLGVVLWWRLRAPDAAVPRRRVVMFVAIVLAQGIIGIVQVLTHLPELVVALHLLGAALVWAGMLRVLLDVNPSLFRPGGPGRDRPVHSGPARATAAPGPVSSL